jgi:hypothetical protein
MTNSGSSGRWGADHAGRRFEVEREPSGLGQVLRLVVDGELRQQRKTNGGRAKLAHGDLTVDIRLATLGSIKRAAILDAAGEEIELLDPPPGTPAAKLAQLERERPGLYAARHVAKAVARVLLPLLGIGALLALPLPAIPEVDLPDLNLPDLPWPSISIELPDWVRSVLAAAQYIVPVVIAILIATHEFERQRKRRRRAGDGRA